MIEFRPTTEPVPLNRVDCGLEASLSLSVRRPFLFPVATGVNVTRITHVAPVGREFGQLLVCTNSDVVVIAVIANGVARWLVRVTELEELVVPTVCWPKLRLVGERVTADGSARQGSTAQVSNKQRTKVWGLSIRKGHLAEIYSRNCM